MLAYERSIYIINRLKEKGIVDLKDLTKDLNISEATVRRDLEKLEREGKLKRVIGGATFIGVEDSENVELTMEGKSNLNKEKKDSIARHAAQFVKDGECVFLDGGTTLVPLINYLANKKIKIVTHNDLIIKKLNKPVADIIVIGGTYLPHYSMNVGTMALKMLEQFSFDHAFIGCCGVDLKEQICFTAEVDTYAIKEIAIQNSRHSYLLIDSSKLEMRGFYKLKKLSEFDKVICNTFICDQELPENFIIVD